MKHQTLREISKFISGLILGDFLFGFWLLSKGIAPLVFFGISFSERGIIAWLVFDALLFIYLVHYGWHTALRPRTSKERKFHLFIGCIFAIVALIHLSRIAFGFDFVVGSWPLPYWLNGLGTIVAIFLSYASFSLAAGEK